MRRDRPRVSARRKPWREAKPVILVVCEGEVTEPQYLNGIKGYLRNPRVAIKIEKAAGVPRTLVAKAKQQRSDAERVGAPYDEVWCVFDRDDHPKWKHSIDVAIAAGLRLAISNACFELWILLHLGESPGAQTRKELQRRVHRAGVQDKKHLRMEMLLPTYEFAVERARRMEERSGERGERFDDPSTSVWRLVRSIEGKPH